jgi:hypothetical protein
MVLKQPTTGRQFGEHLQLREVFQETGQLLGGGPTSQQVLVGTLRAVMQLVLDHFEHEEESDGFAAVVAAAPHLHDRAQALLLEHPRLADQLLAVLQRAAYEEESRARQWAVAAGFDAFVQAFAAHEAAENVLLQEAYGDDIAAED